MIDDRMQADVRRAQSKAIWQSWRELCERVAAQSELSEDLAQLTELLKLPLSCCLAVRKVLQEGNWRKAQSARAYIKKAAMRQARKMYLAVPLQDDTLECGGAPLVFMGGNDLDGATTRVGIEAALENEYREVGKPRSSRMKGAHLVPEQFDPDNKVLDREMEAAESRQSWPSDCWIKQKEMHWKRDWKKWEREPGLMQGKSRCWNIAFWGSAETERWICSGMKFREMQFKPPGSGLIELD